MTPGTTIMTPDSWVDPDYHWQPPADVLYTYDPAKAKQLLDDAGYKDGDGDGIREDKSGKPIKLRLWARSESPESQKTGSLITGWFRDLGLKIEYQVMDDGIYYDSIWGYEGNTYSPDFDLYLWDWDGYADPGDTLASFITSQIENWNEPCWSNAEFDAVVDEANTTLDPEQRKELDLAGAADLLRGVAGDRRPTTRTSSRRSTRRTGTAGRGCTTARAPRSTRATCATAT